MSTNLVIDCDPGHDDAVAILLALQHADVHAITTVSGNAPLEAVTENALRLVDFVGAGVPVHAGAAAPLEGTPRHATHVHGASGFGAVELPPAQAALASEDAVAYLLSASREIPGLWIAPIGPLTNIALAIQRDPGFAGRIAGLSIMGGSAGGGNATATAEFNIYADPEAAAVVFASGANIKMCGLNLTRQVMTDDAYLDEVRKAGDVGAFVARLYGDMHDRMIDLIGERRAALHDPCAVLALTHPDLITFEDRHVELELDGAHTRGMTVVDERPGPARNEPNASVAYSADAAAAKDAILTALLAY